MFHLWGILKLTKEKNPNRCRGVLYIVQMFLSVVIFQSQNTRRRRHPAETNKPRRVKDQGEGECIAPVTPMRRTRERRGQMAHRKNMAAGQRRSRDGQHGSHLHDVNLPDAGCSTLNAWRAARTKTQRARRRYLAKAVDTHWNSHDSFLLNTHVLHTSLRRSTPT